jgi:hypothetical protein
MRSMAVRRILTPRHWVNISNVKNSGQSKQKTLFVLIRKANVTVQENNHYLFLEPYQTYKYTLCGEAKRYWKIYVEHVGTIVTDLCDLHRDCR